MDQTRTTRVCPPHLEFFQEVHVLFLQLHVCLLQLVQVVGVVEHSAAVQHLVLQDVVLHFIGVELFGDVHLHHLKNSRHYKHLHFLDLDLNPPTVLL